MILRIVHGGIGEDGTLQSLLEAEGVPYTGKNFIPEAGRKDEIYHLQFVVNQKQNKFWNIY